MECDYFILRGGSTEDGFELVLSWSISCIHKVRQVNTASEVLSLFWGADSTPSQDYVGWVDCHLCDSPAKFEFVALVRP